MAIEDTETDELVEARPAPGTLIRHRRAELTVHPVERAAPRVELRRGALWVRATDEGPGVLVTHGASTVQVRSGAAVIEALDFEALLVVVAGRAAVKGTAALPRSVSAGQAVTLSLDGTFGDPESLSAAELAADRMVVENLALDSLASVPDRAVRPSEAPPAPGPPPAVVDLRADTDAGPAPDGGADDVGTPEWRPDDAGAPATILDRDAPAPGDDPPPAPEPEPAPAPDPAPVAEVEVDPEPDVEPEAPPVPRAPERGEPSALETALAGVGIPDPEDEALAAPPAAAPEEAPAKARKGGREKAPKAKADKPKADKAKAEKPRARKGEAEAPKEKKGREAKSKAPKAPKAPPPPRGDDPTRRLLLVLVIGLLLVLAVVIATVMSADHEPDPSGAAALGLLALF